MTFDIGRFRLEVWEQWSHLWRFKEFNWINFDLIRCEFEYSPYKESVEINLSLLNFCSYWLWYYGEWGESESK